MFGPDLDRYKALLKRRMEWRDISPEEKTRRMEEDHLPAFWQIAPYLADEARRVAKECAMSYRQFCVGSALYAFNSRPYYASDFYRVFRGSNMKPYPDGPSICAEIVATLAAKHERYELIIGIVIAGQPQEDHASGLITPTLQPCGKCRSLLAAMPEIREDTVILTVNLQDDGYEIHNFAEILAKHNCCEK